MLPGCKHMLESTSHLGAAGDHEVVVLATSPQPCRGRSMIHDVHIAPVPQTRTIGRADPQCQKLGIIFRPPYTTGAEISLAVEDDFDPSNGFRHKRAVRDDRVLAQA